MPDRDKHIDKHIDKGIGKGIGKGQPDDTAAQQRVAADAAKDVAAQPSETEPPSPEAEALTPAVAEMKAALRAAKEELEKHVDLWMRAKADLENTRKKAEREVRNVRLYAIEGFASQLLEVKDNLERSLLAFDKSSEQAAKQVKELYAGVELTLKLLTDAFEKFGITECNPDKEAFNPQHHQAMQVLESQEHPPNTVLAVIQKGYLLNDRLLRPAMVVVSKAPANASTEPEP